MVKRFMEWWLRMLEYFVIPVAGLGMFLIAFPVSTMLLGQPSQPSILKSEFQIQELEKRADKEEDQSEKLILVLQGMSERLTILETIQRSGEDKPWERGTSVGTGLLLIEAAFRISVKRINSIKEKKAYGRTEE